ncbi:MAG: L,D-transpeptidase family protein [Gemmatimonas sp.]
MPDRQSPRRLRCLLAAVATVAIATTGSPVGAQEAASPRLRTIVESGAATAPLLDDDRQALERFYSGRGFRPAWTDARARETAVVALSAAGAEGLSPTAYGAPTQSAPWPANAAAAAERDAVLTAGVLRYMRDVHLGRIRPGEVYDDVELPRPSYDAAAALARALDRGNLAEVLAALPPPHVEYRRLKAALATYRAVDAAGGWPRVPPGPTFDAFGGDPRLPTLARRLAIEDKDVAIDVDPTALDTAIRRYQTNNGLVPDGRVGARTIAALNVPAARRVEQIRANLERWRWLPPELERRRVMVNVAGAELAAIRDGSVIVESRVIVGDRRHHSPMLRTVASGLTVNPPWNVPPSIARNEIVPRLRRDPGYLRAEDMVVLNGPPGDPYGQTIDWRHAPASGYGFRQLPGPRNALGTIKVEMANRFNVYLHDTPAKTLFALPDRNLSHGCIRVEGILPLASFLLGDSGDGDISSLEAAIARGATIHLAARAAVPVYLVYWTAVANADGSVGFRDDAYQRDPPLIEALGRDSIRQTSMGTSIGCRHNVG